MNVEKTTVSKKRDLIDAVYVWGISPEKPSDVEAWAYEIGDQLLSTTDPAKFAQADAQSRAAILGVNNIFMAGWGLPKDLTLATKTSRSIAGLERVVWELNPDDQADPMVYTERLKVFGGIKGIGPTLEAVLCDDMMRFTPSQVESLRRQVNAEAPGVRLWGVVYVHLFRDQAMDQGEHIKLMDGITLWNWDPADFRDIEQNVARIEEMAPGKPITLGLYMWDYQNKAKMPREMMRLQCEKALALAKQGRIRGLVFLAVNNDAETITWTRDWIREHATERIPVEE